MERGSRSKGRFAYRQGHRAHRLSSKDSTPSRRAIVVGAPDGAVLSLCDDPHVRPVTAGEFQSMERTDRWAPSLSPPFTWNELLVQRTTTSRECDCRISRGTTCGQRSSTRSHG